MSEQIGRPDGYSSQPRVLLVEDDQGNRRRIREILANEGIDVVGEGSDGQAGIELTARLEPDVVLMDLRMPRMGGLEATREIKRALPLTQVIVLTSYDGPLPTRSAEQAGAYAYLVKGCQGDLMRDVIYQAWKYKLGLEQEQVDQEGGLAQLFGEGGGGMSATVYVRADKDELVVDVTGANPNTAQTATVNLWSGRSPVAAASGSIATLAETWTDNVATTGSGQTFGSLAAIIRPVISPPSYSGMITSSAPELRMACA